MGVFTKAISSTSKICTTNGLNIVAGGTGIADVTLAAPQPGHRCIIRISSISSGSVVVTTPTGITMDGTNNTATFDTANDTLTLVYNTSTAWAVENNTSVTLSSV